MIKLHETITVKCPFDVVTAYLLDFSNIEQWDPGVLAATKTTAGIPRVGTLFTVTLNLSGEPEMVYEVLEITGDDDQWQIVLNGVAENFTALDTITVTRKGGKVDVDYQAEMRFLDGRSKAEWLLRPLLNKIGRKAVHGLGEALDMQFKPVQANTGVAASVGRGLFAPHLLRFTRKGYKAIPQKGLCFDMRGKTVLVTGPTSGLGKETAIGLARMGATVALAGRDKSRLQAVQQAIIDDCGHDRAIIYEADFSDLDDVRALARAVIDEQPTLSVLVNNAGALFDDFAKAGDYERTALIDYYAPQLLSEALLPLLKKNQGRIINVSSGGMYLQPLVLEWLSAHPEKTSDLAKSFNGASAYANAKRAMVMMARHLQQHSLGEVAVHSMHPGWANTPGVEKSLPDFHRKMQKRLRTPRMGADTIKFLAAHPLLGPNADPLLVGGFWFDRKLQPIHLLRRTKSSDSLLDILIGLSQQTLAPYKPHDA